MILNQLFNSLSIEEQLKISNFIKTIKLDIFTCYSCKNKKNGRNLALSSSVNKYHNYYEMATCSKECEEYLRLLLC